MSQDHALIERHLQTALELVSTEASAQVTPPKRKTLEAHVEAALNLSPEASPLEQEPIRTIHHLSCTGGTLFAKCIASMANVLLLNEIDLHSSMPTQGGGKPAFTPTDIISLLRQGDENLSPDLINKIFLADLAVLREEQWKIGRSIVLRDHSHSHFLTGKAVVDNPTLWTNVMSAFPVKSIVTIRNPVDSWLSMEKLGWNKMLSPPTFDEYCRRYILFLEHYDGMPIVKYEDFVKEPKKVMQKICGLLSLKYFDEFESVFSSFSFSGDSGRGGRTISKRSSLEQNKHSQLYEHSNYIILNKMIEKIIKR